MRSLWPLILVFAGCAGGPGLRADRTLPPTAPAEPTSVRQTAYKPEAVEAPTALPISGEVPAPSQAGGSAGPGQTGPSAGQAPEGATFDGQSIRRWSEWPSDGGEAGRLPPAWQEPTGDLGWVYPDDRRPFAVVTTGPTRYGRLLACGSDLLDRVGADYVHYYSFDNLAALGLGIGVAAVMANTSIDQDFQDYYQTRIRNQDTGEYTEILHVPEILGDGRYTIPFLALVTVVGSVFEEDQVMYTARQWSLRSLRGMAVGWPPLLALQYITGASRPGESSTGSQWNPFQDNNGVSGHTFMGAVPLITAAKMTHSPLWKAAFYVVSTWAGISRINDNRHYLSQVVLGWWMGYLAATAVDRTEQAAASLRIFPVAFRDGLGVAVLYDW